jgi:hypothetical protein
MVGVKRHPRPGSIRNRVAALNRTLSDAAYCIDTHCAMALQLFAAFVSGPCSLARPVKFPLAENLTIRSNLTLEEARPVVNSVSDRFAVETI